MSRLLNLWQGILHVGFAVLCLRYIHAVGVENSSITWPLGLVLVASAGLGAWRPQAALFGFAVFMPLLNGLPILGVAGGSPSIVFTALWLGWTGRRLAYRPDRRAGEFALSSSPRLGWILSATDLLITAFLLSLVVQLWRHHDDAQIWTTFYRHTAAGYGDPYYFLSAAFTWLQGLFWFRALTLTWQSGSWSAGGERTCRQPQRSPDGSEQLPYSPTREDRQRHRGSLIAIQIRPVFLSTAGLTALFTLGEYKLSLTENPLGVGFQSAYEDIFSFGGFAAAIFVFAVTILTKKSWGNLLWQILYSAGVLALVIVSWSRGIWLAAIIFLLFVAWFRLPRWCTVIFLATAVVAVGVINLQAQKGLWQRPAYMARLAELVRIENLSTKSPERLSIYRKAVDMISERPLSGHGIGSFYLSSLHYAKAGDPYASIPNFAHNAFLQIAAEQGVVVAGLFVGLISWTLWRGVRAWQATGGRQAALIPGSRPAEDRLTLLGTTLALGVLVQTNLSSNSLNIYASNQFFFWFLMAAVLSLSRNYDPPGVESHR